MLEWLKTVLENIRNSIRPDGSIVMSSSELLYNAALSYIGSDASPNDLAPDELGCAETVDAIYHRVFAEYIGRGARPCLSTATLFVQLKSSGWLKQVIIPKPGDIVISPTGSTGSKGPGHTGIVGRYQIMSNDSRSGTWEANYTVESWRRIFGRRGFPTYFFRCG